LLVFIAALAALWLGYGPLFAWLPIAPGFRERRVPSVTVLFRDPPGLPIAADALTHAMADLERAVGLTFTSPVRVVLCDEWSDFTRFTPWLTISHGLGAITLPIGLVTYVTPLVRGRGDLLDFIKHEASHVLLYEHASIQGRLQIEHQAWLVEGIGVAFGNPRSYEDRDEFRREATEQDLRAVIDPLAPGHGPGRGGFRFSYSAYGYFVNFVIDRFGAQRFQRFVKGYVEDPTSYRDQFERVFGTTLEDAIGTFAASLSH
jgi:hypothetical protein